MLKPTNPAAEQVEFLQSVNSDIDSQIAALEESKKANLELILYFREVATWEDVEDEQDIWSDPVNDLSPDSPDDPAKATVIENPIR